MYFDFSDDSKSPAAMVNFTSDYQWLYSYEAAPSASKSFFLYPNQAYDISLELYVAPSTKNSEMGMLSIQTRLFSTQSQSHAKLSRRQSFW